MLFLRYLGFFLFCLGGLLELVGMVGMVSYRLRRILPVASPITLAGWGRTAFVSGAICWILADVFVGP